MEETKQLSEKEQLIESALEKVLQGGDINFKLAIWDLQMAEEKTISSVDVNKNPNREYNLKIILIRRFLEILLGLNNSKEELLKLLVDGVSFKKREGNWEEIKNIEQIMYNRYERFLTNEMPDIWLKSLKYDAIIKTLESSESDEQKDKDTLFKVLAIIGKS